MEEQDNRTESQKIKDVLFEEIQVKTNDLRFFKESALRRHGWEQSCSFPDACWRWCKEIGGQTIAVSLADALGIEREIVNYKELAKGGKDEQSN